MVKKFTEALDFGLVPVMRAVAAVFMDTGRAIGAVAAALVEVSQGHFAAAKEVFVSFGEDVKKSFQGLTDKTGISKAFEGMADIANRVGNAARDGFAEVKSGASATVSPVNQARDALDDLTSAEKKLGEQGKKLSEELQDIKPGEQMKKEMEISRAELAQHLIDVGTFTARESAAFAKSNAAELAQLKAAQSQKLISHTTYNTAVDALEKRHVQQRTMMQLQQKQMEQQQLEQRLGYTSQFFGNVSSLMRTKSAELFEIGKAAAIAQAIVDGHAAVQKTLASVPYPFSIPLAAAAGVAAAVNVANISQQHLATGIDSVPGIGNRDNFSALLAPGERVVPADTNKDLKAFLSGSSPMVQLLSAMNSKLDSIGQMGSGPIVVQIDGRAIAIAVRDQTRAGRSIT